jgi:hypothetical protein
VLDVALDLESPTWQPHSQPGQPSQPAATPALIVWDPDNYPPAPKLKIVLSSPMDWDPNLHYISDSPIDENWSGDMVLAVLGRGSVFPWNTTGDGNCPINGVSQIRCFAANPQLDVERLVDASPPRLWVYEEEHRSLRQRVSERIKHMVGEGGEWLRLLRENVVSAVNHYVSTHSLSTYDAKFTASMRAAASDAERLELYAEHVGRGKRHARGLVTPTPKPNA